MHLDDEALRAFADRQIDRAEEAVNHLNSCAECQSRLSTIQARTARVNARLAALDPAAAEAPRSAQIALARLARRTNSFADSEKEPAQMFNKLFSKRLRPAWIAVCTIVVLGVLFSFPSVQAFAGSLLAQFRVSKITVVEVNNNRLNELVGNTALAKQVASLVSDSVNVTKEPGKPQVVANASAASKAAGFNVRVAGNRSDTPTITVQDGGAFQFVVNRARAQSLLNQMGASNIQLPASIDGKTIKVSVPNGVSIAYGDCPKPSENATGSPGRRYVNCLMLVEIPSPTVDTPPDMDVKQLAELGLQFTGMSPDQARAFSQKVDWTSTLVIPVPRNGASYKELTVDGTTGYLIERPVDDAPQYVITWVKDGIIYAVGGLGSNTTAALGIANSLK